MGRSSSWDDSRRGSGETGFWRRVLGALVAALILHAVILYALGKIPFVAGVVDAMEWESRFFNVEQVEFLPETVVEEAVPEAVEAEAPEDTASLLMEIEELLPQLQDLEVDVSPEIIEPEVALKMEAPALAGEDTGELLEPVRAPEISPDLAELGSSELLFTEVPEGRIVIEEGAVNPDIPDPDDYLREAARKGAGGLSEEGVLEGYTSLGSLLTLPSGELAKSKAALPSDLLFEYDSATLKEGARLGLMKLAILIDRNPSMYCILEGHTDLFGNDAYNMDLSEQRAQAVKNWLVDSLRLDGERIIVKGYGKTRAKVVEGSIEEQAINRRVDILMRKELPAEDPVFVRPVRAIAVEEEEASEPVLVTPQGPPRAEPVEEDVLPAEPVEAVPVEDTRSPGRAVPVEE